MSFEIFEIFGIFEIFEIFWIFKIPSVYADAGKQILNLDHFNAASVNHMRENSQELLDLAKQLADGRTAFSEKILELEGRKYFDI